ncbi:hypothetical protein [Vibrio hepatarius]|uniref:hypothetical protein n=1 Tax=Vibrio hepatarius TaxID=171383 RepID=UPI00148C824C|nr:hypothetical protein [Vibrio hepatarius]NOI14810.1 hypothetical protein [Vibrio hepatarius]
MKIEVKDLNKSHPLVLAAHLMSVAYHQYETMIPACEMVLEQFPQLTPEQVICLWVGVNCANNDC